MRYPKTRKRADYGMMNCTDCGKETPRRHPTMQKYCPECSAKHNAERSRKHHIEKGRQRVSEEQEKWRETGRQISHAERQSTSTYSPMLAWYERIEIPFSWSGSKNHIFANTQRGHTFMRDEARYYRSEITSKVAEVMASRPLRKNKLWIDIFVQKPSHRGDAANFLDMVCDAIKDALPLDDRWYSVRGIDWQIVKFEPSLFIGLGQEDVPDVQACSYCGRLLTYDNFQKNRSSLTGVGRLCRDCQAVTGKRRRRVVSSALQEPPLPTYGVFA